MFPGPPPFPVSETPSGLPLIPPEAFFTLSYPQWFFRSTRPFFHFPHRFYITGLVERLMEDRSHLPGVSTSVRLPSRKGTEKQNFFSFFNPSFVVATFFF